MNMMYRNTGIIRNVMCRDSSMFISVINQLVAQHFCFTISLFHASKCFEHMCSKHVEA